MPARLPIATPQRRIRVFGGIGYASISAGGSTFATSSAQITTFLSIATLWPWLVKRIEWCCATHGAGKGRSWQNAFKIGAAEVVVKRLAEANQTTRAALGTTALARVEPALKRREEAVQAFVQDNMRMKRGRRLRVDAEGYTQGRARGATMDLGGPGLTDGG